MTLVEQNLHTASRDSLMEHFRRIPDVFLFPGTCHNFDLCCGLGQAGLDGIHAVGLQEGDHVCLADGAGIPVVVIKQRPGDAQVGGLQFGKPLLLDQAVAHAEGGPD